MFRTLSVFLLACLFQGYLFLDRQEIIDQYKPILDETAKSFAGNVSLANTSYAIVLEEVENTTLIGMQQINTQITSLKTQIADIRNVSANNSAIISCVAETDAAVTKLTSQPLNTTCYFGVTYPDFASATDDFTVLATIPSKTIDACTTLNPLPSQDDQFLNCITMKILDLQQQLSSVQKRFDDEKTATLKTLETCLSTQASQIIIDINQIIFQVNLCQSLS